MRMSQFKFSPGWHRLSPAWQAPAAFVLTFMLAMPVADFSSIHIAAAANEGRTWAAYYYIAMNVMLLIAAPMVFLPRTHNSSSVKWWRGLGRLRLLVRFLLLGGLMAALCSMGIACEHLTPQFLS